MSISNTSHGLEKGAASVVPDSSDIDQTVITNVMRALSNPNRLRIFLMLRDERLAGHEDGLRVGEIAETLDVTQSTVSHHLRELEHAGLIQLERQGKGVYCSVLAEPVSTVIEGLGFDL
jgi:DNA-binding transcriptional ArsR family regulator